ncbi:MAG: FecR domain-containing protein [Elusimicrobia bacterium]|nr:FecR domain-containing protein [Elusimicrobiota bacterium]
MKKTVLSMVFFAGITGISFAQNTSIGTAALRPEQRASGSSSAGGSVPLPQVSEAMPTTNLCIYKLKGTVEVQSAGRQDWIKTSKPSTLNEGDIVRTGKKSFCEILMKDGTYARIDENSTLKIDSAKISSEERNFSFNALFGKLMFMVSKFKTNNSKFQVRTPAAVCAVRGTEFAIIVSSDAVNAGVFEGKLAVGTETEEKELNPDTEALVKSGREIAVAARLSMLMKKEKQRCMKLRAYVEKTRERLANRQDYIDSYLNLVFLNMNY